MSLLLTVVLALAAPTAPTCVLPDGYKVNLELAVTDQERATGLMYRDHLEPDWGMLFVFDQEGYWPFWMKNTLLPLDILWLDRNGQVVEIVSPAQPCKLDPCPSYTPKAAGRAVLELAAGTAAKHGVKVGTKLVVTGVSGFPVKPAEIVTNPAKPAKPAK